jgi:D-arabinose 5-phosphate isomerase GutQ
MNTALGNKQNTILSGTSDPDSSLGEDGDIYIQYES